MTDEAIKAIVLSMKPSNIAPGFNHIEYYVEQAIKFTRKITLEEIGIFIGKGHGNWRY